MNEFQATLAFATLFVLRCVAPLVITLIIGYLMNRLVDRWEAEEAARRQGQAQPEAIPGLRPSLSLPSLRAPCGLIGSCDPKNCPLYQEYGARCWLVRLQTEGVLPANCTTCPVYTQATA